MADPISGAGGLQSFQTTQTLRDALAQPRLDNSGVPLPSWQSTPSIPSLQNYQSPGARLGITGEGQQLVDPAYLRINDQTNPKPTSDIKFTIGGGAEAKLTITPNPSDGRTGQLGVPTPGGQGGRAALEVTRNEAVFRAEGGFAAGRQQAVDVTFTLGGPLRFGNWAKLGWEASVGFPTSGVGAKLNIPMGGPGNAITLQGAGLNNPTPQYTVGVTSQANPNAVSFSAQQVIGGNFDLGVGNIPFNDVRLNVGVTVNQQGGANLTFGAGLKF